MYHRYIKARALLIVDDSPLYVPPPTLDGLPDMQGVRVCVTGYTGDRRSALIAVVNLLGAEYMRVLDRKSTHLVCFEFEGAKWAKANLTKAQRIVSHAWLEECLRRWKRLPEEAYATRSGKEEDELAAAAAAEEDEAEAEVPDSEDDEDDPLMNDDNAGAGGAGVPPPTRNSLGTFVTELTAGMIPGGSAGGDEEDDDADAAEVAGMEAGGFIPANDENDANEEDANAPAAAAPAPPARRNTVLRGESNPAATAVTPSTAAAAVAARNGNGGNAGAGAGAAAGTPDRFAFAGTETQPQTQSAELQVVSLQPQPVPLAPPTRRRQKKGCQLCSFHFQSAGSWFGAV